MKTFPNNLTKVSVSFICDICGVSVPFEVDFAGGNKLNFTVTCPVCSKQFTIDATRGEGTTDSQVSISDIDADDITIE